MTVRLVLLAALAASAAPGRASAAETSLACDGGIVALGDTKLDLLAKCGRPALEDLREVDDARLVVAPDGRTAAATETRVVEEWSYDFGPQRFVMHVRLARGKVVAIDRGSYGYGPERLAAPPGDGGRARCDASALRVGDAKLDLLAKCGPPALQERTGVRPPTLVTSATRRALAAVEVEVWTYDFGPQSLVQLVTLENGRVVKVESGGYGYAK